MIKDFPHAARGQSFSIVSKPFHGQTSGGIPVGSNTGRMLHRQPWYIKEIIFPKRSSNISRARYFTIYIASFCPQNAFRFGQRPIPVPFCSIVVDYKSGVLNWNKIFEDTSLWPCFSNVTRLRIH